MHTFSGPPGDGALPYWGLALAGTTLYGTTSCGGRHEYIPGTAYGDGTVFNINTDGSGYSVLKEFAGDDGRTPYAGLLFVGKALYGTTGSGGLSNNGVVFSLSLAPIIQEPPQSQTAEMGSTISFSARAEGAPTLGYQWFFNSTNSLSAGTNSLLRQTNVQPSEAGSYTVIVTNTFGAVTSAPATLQVIAPVERRPVPAINLAGDVGSVLNLDYANSLVPPPNWLLLDTVSLVSTSQLYFDTTAPLAPQRFYRTCQTGTPVLMPSLSLVSLVPAINLSGTIGDHLRLDYINQVGPIDAWVTVDTITLTNTSQLYFDVTSIGQPPRLYRLVPIH